MCVHSKVDTFPVLKRVLLNDNKRKVASVSGKRKEKQQSVATKETVIEQWLPEDSAGGTTSVPPVAGTSSRYHGDKLAEQDTFVSAAIPQDVSESWRFILEVNFVEHTEGTETESIIITQFVIQITIYDMK